MGELVELDDYRRIWTTGWVRCVSCEHQWIAVYRVDQRGLECPKCGDMGGSPFERG